MGVDYKAELSNSSPWHLENSVETEPVEQFHPLHSHQSALSWFPLPPLPLLPSCRRTPINTDSAESEEEGKGRSRNLIRRCDGDNVGDWHYGVAHTTVGCNCCHGVAMT